VWTDFLFFHNIGVALPIIVLFTDLFFVGVFAWTYHKTSVGVDAAGVEAAARIPVGSAPPARWLLRLVSFPTIVVVAVVVVASIVEVSNASTQCLTVATANRSSCTVLGTTNLWSLPPSLVWLWGGMAAIVAAAMMWASVDVVRRRDIIGFGIAAHLIPVGAVILGSFSAEEHWQPTPDFLLVVLVVELLAALGLWLALRSANASALALGDDIPRPPDDVAVATA
jgi:hypothetical protein